MEPNQKRVREFHLGLDMEPVDIEIHRSNMLKLWPDGRPNVRADGKVIKPPNWRPPNIGAVIGCQK